MFEFYSFPDYVIENSPDDIDYSLFKVTKESVHFSLMPWDYEEFKRVMSMILPDKNETLRMLDGTAHVGVESIVISKMYPNFIIDSVEIDKNVFELLKENIKTFDAINITAHNDDFINYMDNLDYQIKYDLLYLDPPWGGKSYKEKKSVMLELSGIPIYEVVDDLFYQNKVSHVILKSPYNFDIKRFKNNIDDSLSVEEYKIERHKKSGETRIAFKVYSIKKEIKSPETFTNLSINGLISNEYVIFTQDELETRLPIYLVNNSEYSNGLLEYNFTPNDKNFSINSLFIKYLKSDFVDYGKELWNIDQDTNMIMYLEINNSPNHYEIYQEINKLPELKDYFVKVIDFKYGIPEREPYITSLDYEYDRDSIIVNYEADHEINFISSYNEGSSLYIFSEIPYGFMKLSDILNFIKQDNSYIYNFIGHVDQNLDIGEKLSIFIMSIIVNVMSILEIAKNNLGFTHYNLILSNIWLRPLKYTFENVYNVSKDVQVFINNMYEIKLGGLEFSNIGKSNPTFDIWTLLTDFFEFYNLDDFDVPLEFYQSLFDDFVRLITIFIHDDINIPFDKYEYIYKNFIIENDYPKNLDLEIDYLDFIKYMIDENIIDNVLFEKHKVSSFTFENILKNYRGETKENKLVLIRDRIFSKLSNVTDLEILYSIIEDIDIYTIQKKEISILRDRIFSKLENVDIQVARSIIEDLNNFELF